MVCLPSHWLPCSGNCHTSVQIFWRKTSFVSHLHSHSSPFQLCRKLRRNVQSLSLLYTPFSWALILLPSWWSFWIKDLRSSVPRFSSVAVLTQLQSQMWMWVEVLSDIISNHVMFAIWRDEPRIFPMFCRPFNALSLPCCFVIWVHFRRQCLTRYVYVYYVYVF